MALALLVCLWCFSVLVLAVVALWFGHIPGFRRVTWSAFCCVSFLLSFGVGFRVRVRVSALSYLLFFL